MPVRLSMPVQAMPTHFAAGYYNSKPTVQNSPVPVISNLSHHQSNVLFTQMPAANFHQVKHVLPVSANVQNPFASQPVMRYNWPAVQTQQQFPQQQFLFHSAPAAGSNLMRPVVLTGMPLITPQCIPASGVHAGPAISPVFQQPLTQARLIEEKDKHLGQVKAKDISSQQFSVAFTQPYPSTSICTKSSLLPSCSATHSTVVSAVLTHSAAVSDRTNVKDSNRSGEFRMGATSVLACSKKVCEPTLTTVSNQKPLEASNLLQSSVVNEYEASSPSAVSWSQADLLPEESSNSNKCESQSLSTSEQVTTGSFPQICNGDKTEVDFICSARQLGIGSLREVCNTAECRTDSVLNKEHIQETSLPVEAVVQFTQKELQSPSVSKSDDTVKSSSIPVCRDILPALPSLPLSSNNGTDCGKLLGTGLSSPVAETSWFDIHVRDRGDSASLCSEDKLLGCSNSEANSLAKSVQRIIEQQNLKEVGADFINSWSTNAVCDDDIWTKPTDVNNIWSSAAACTSDSHLNPCHVSTAGQDHTFQPSVVASVGSALDSDTEDHCDMEATESGQETISTVMASAAETGLYGDQPDIWPTSFGPFTRPPECTSSSIGRLPPGLETQVLAKFGVIGQRVPERQMSPAVDNSDSGVELVSGDNSLCAVNSCCISELSVGASLSPSSETAVSTAVTSNLTDLLEQEAAVPPMEPSTTLLTDIISAITTQIAAHKMNTSEISDKSASEGELKTIGLHPSSFSCLSSSALDDSYVTPVTTTYSDVDQTVTHTVTNLHEIASSQSKSPSAEGTQCTDNAVWLTDTIVQLLDMLRKPQAVCECLHSVDNCSADNRSTMDDKAATCRDANSLSQDVDVAKTSCEMSTACAANSLTKPHTSANYDPVFGITSAADGQNERIAVDEEINIAKTSCEMSTACVANSLTRPHTSANYDPVFDTTSAADGQNERIAVDEEINIAKTLCEMSTACVANSSIRPHSTANYDPVFGTTSAADGQKERIVVDEEINIPKTLCEMSMACVVTSLTKPHTSANYDPVFSTTSAADRHTKRIAADKDIEINLPVCGASTCSDSLGGTIASGISKSPTTLQSCIKYNAHPACGKNTRAGSTENVVFPGSVPNMSSKKQSKRKTRKHATNCAPDSRMDDLLVLLERWKL